LPTNFNYCLGVYAEMYKTCKNCGSIEFYKSGDCRLCSLRLNKEYRTKNKNIKISKELLMEHYKYDATTGIFIRNKSTGGYRKKTVAGTFSKDGYIRITILGKQYLAHRLVWLYEYGEMPKHQIDHINGNRSDNRLSNLRAATNKQNMENINTKSNSKSGIRGVYSYKIKNTIKWGARLMHNYKTIHLGVFNDIDSAKRARKLGEEKYFSHSK
jgi:hypothetical protein